MKDVGSSESESAVRLRPGAASALPEVSVDLTTELRWFFDGRLPEEVLSWFTRGGATGLVEDRCDAYRLDGQVDIGVKRRFGTVFELKLRQGSPEPFFIGRDMDGWLETWQRWSPADGRIHLTENTTWVDVDKTVVKRRFSSDGQELPLSEETRAISGQGCDAEIATVSVRGRTGWTFALAAFGPADGRRSSLELAWHALVSGRRCPRRLQLHCANSCGYPEWIAKVSNGDASSSRLSPPPAEAGQTRPDDPAR